MAKLTSYERFTRRLGGEPVDRTPNFNIMMTFAAHFMKEIAEYPTACCGDESVQPEGLIEYKDGTKSECAFGL